MKTINLTNVFEHYKGQWVALIHDTEVVSADTDITKVYQEAQKKGYTKARLFKVPQENIPFVGSHV